MRFRKPRRVQNRSGHFSINVRPDYAFERESKRLIFVFTIAGPCLWKESAVQHIGKQDGVGTIGQAEAIEDSLFRQSVNAGELFHALLQFRTLLKLLNEAMGCIYGTFNPSMRLILVELEHQIYGELIGGIFLPPEEWNFENVENSVPDLVQGPKKKWPNDRVVRSNSL
jgi:hypothetical protein